MATLEPIPDEPAAVVTLEAERALVIADYHAGYEVGLRQERGVEVPSRAINRRERLCSLLERTGVDRLIVLGDLMHSIGDPGGAERGELEVLFESLPRGVEVTLVRGNHDGAIERWLEGDVEAEKSENGELERRIGGTHIQITDGTGIRLDGLGCCHGHTWPDRSVLGAATVCLGHEHPCVRLEDEVGGARIERVWLRGKLDPGPFRKRKEYQGMGWLDGETDPPEVVVVPAFNDLVGGTWTNLEGQSFLAPFFPEGFANTEAYLLDGTRLGPYRQL
ncbi:metallophosphoesterase [Natrialbaceae archaeon A-chndr2]|uniref:metallophosphoesterase n=1 Tax=Natronosalvus amylolyticus TaxID=2961994 RepID=UPI0020C979A2|nr:metallophosphoesterase [Natronosalvus amylolyticus]